MGSSKQKFYVVWQGHKPGIYHSWEDCQKQTFGFPQAKFKAYTSLDEAKLAFEVGPDKSYVKRSTLSERKTTRVKPTSGINPISIAVDAACAGNPGMMEYRGVETISKKELFHIGPYPQGTNNIGEFLAIVHALAYLQKLNRPDIIIYSDSQTAISWVKNKKLKTTLMKNHANAYIFELIDRAIHWLHANTWRNTILKWETEHWGENPADFDRK